MKLKTKLTRHVLGVLFVSVLCIGCSPEDGKDGATGPEGPQGEDGQQGIQGEQGEQGDTGTANVIYSEWIDSPLDGSIPSSTANGSIDVPGLSQEIFDNGTVLLYGKAGSINVFALPFVGASGVSYYYRLSVGSINIRMATVDGTDIGEPLFGQYRYIIIPGGVKASNGIGGISGKSSSTKSSQDYAGMSYEEIIAYFNISE